MRRFFAQRVLERMRVDDRIWVLSADMGYGIWDSVVTEFPLRFVNPGSAEQVALDIAIGLSLSGRIPIVYSITPFLLLRPYEALRTYVNHERLPVKLVGSGRGREYAADGISHWADGEADWLRHMRHLRVYRPTSLAELERLLVPFLEEPLPGYLNLSRFD